MSDACVRFRAETQRLIAAARPDLVVMSNADYVSRLINPDGDALLSEANAVDLWTEQVGRFADALREQGVPLAVIANNPNLSQDPIECLARHRDAERCAEPSSPLLARLAVVTEPERAALAQSGVAGILDVAPLICDDNLCLVEDESGPIFSDRDHLTATFVSSATPLVAVLVAESLD